MKPKKNPHAVALGRKGGLALAKKLSPERRHEIAMKAGLANKKKWELRSPSERAAIELKKCLKNKQEVLIGIICFAIAETCIQFRREDRYVKKIAIYRAAELVGRLRLMEEENDKTFK